MGTVTIPDMLHPLYVVEIAGMTELIDVLLSHRMWVFKIRNHRRCNIWGDKILACYETVTLFTQDNKSPKRYEHDPQLKKIHLYSWRTFDQRM